MTDKQIIIDGVDVSECEYYNKDDKTCREVNGNYDTDLCEFDKCENSNCHYKNWKRKEQNLQEAMDTSIKEFNRAEELKTLLKRKEQECEESKEEIGDLKEIIQRHDNDNNALLSEFEDDLVDYYRRYKECLTEIKEIAENMNNECFYDDFECKDCDMKNGCTYFNKKQILQKISECEANQ